MCRWVGNGCGCMCVVDVWMGVGAGMRSPKIASETLAAALSHKDFESLAQKHADLILRQGCIHDRVRVGGGDSCG